VPIPAPHLPLWFPLLRLLLSLLIMAHWLLPPRAALRSLVALCPLSSTLPALPVLLLWVPWLRLARLMPLLHRVPLRQVVCWSLRPLWLRWILTTRTKAAPSWKTWARWWGVRICS
jgi:hypothetical protein